MNYKFFKYYVVFLSGIIIFFCSFQDASAKTRMAISVPLANIRSGPGLTYDVLWQAEKYYPIVVIKSSGQWYYFKDFENDKGWVNKKLVKKINTVVTKRLGNIRSGPGTKYSIVFKAEAGVVFKVKKKRGKWLYVRHADGDKGWIFRSLVW